jgi:hypothetical protein
LFRKGILGYCTSDFEKQNDDSRVKNEKQSLDSPAFLSEVNNNFPLEVKIALFRSLLKGGENLYAERFESLNEWVQGIVRSPK